MFHLTAFIEIINKPAQNFLYFSIHHTKYIVRYDKNIFLCLKNALATKNKHVKEVKPLFERICINMKCLAHANTLDFNIELIGE